MIKLIVFITLFLLYSCKDKGSEDSSAPKTDGGNSNSNNLMSGVSTEGLPKGGKVFRLKQGSHENAGLHVSLTPRRQYGWQAYFYDDTAYQSKDPANQHDINKLVGFSDCFSQHHKNSARFGWNWDLENKVMKIHAYSYKGGERQWAYIKSVPLKTIVTLSLQVKDHEYIFFADGVEVRLPRNCKDYWAWGYGLFPYFGGDETAPHDMHIWLKDI